MTLKDINQWVREALKCKDKQYQLVEVCRTVQELERERCARLMERQSKDKVLAQMIRELH
jgi:hypothetical protein